MKKFVLILCLILFYCATGFCDSSAKIPDGLKPGISRTKVRSLIGLPVQMRGDMWKYMDYVVLFESNAVKCVVKTDCFGKWSDCRSFKMRSPECILVSDK
ncbi:MAG: hypothetical protein H6681_05495 [Desulfobacteraceae bacterium]|nr:hypothetical protein [Desulfobacteraceae bacterium]